MQSLIKNLISFRRVTAKSIGDYFDIKGCGANNYAMTHRRFLRQWWCGPNSQRKGERCDWFFDTMRSSNSDLCSDSLINWSFFWVGGLKFRFLYRSIASVCSVLILWSTDFLGYRCGFNGYIFEYCCPTLVLVIHFLPLETSSHFKSCDSLTCMNKFRKGLKK